MFVPIPPCDQTMPLKVIRCKANASLRVVIVCRVMRGVNTHYLNAQTMVCQNGPTCAGCERNMKPRWQGFTIVSDPEQERFALLAFTRPVAVTLERSSHPDGTLTGTDLTLSRLGKRENSPLLCKINGHNHVSQLWQPEQLENILRRLFADQKNIRTDCLVGLTLSHGICSSATSSTKAPSTLLWTGLFHIGKMLGGPPPTGSPIAYQNSARIATDRERLSSRFNRVPQR